MKIISWNTNGLRATIKNNLFSPLFDKYKPDIVCFQETKCEAEQLPESIRDYSGYESHFSHSKNKKGYSGTAIYTKIKPAKVEYGIGIKEFDDEGRTVVMYFNGFGNASSGAKSKKWILVNCYFPNGGGGPVRLDYKLRFYDAFLKFINKKKKAGYSVIFTGDVNTAHEAIDLARPKENEENTGFLPVERDWVSKVVKNGYVDTFRALYPKVKDMYSYWDQKTKARSRNVGWRIDYFFVSEDLMKRVINSSMMTKYLGSDHCPIVLDLK